MAKANIPVTAVELIPSIAKVKVTAEYPHPNQLGWTKVQYLLPLAQQPNVGDIVQVTIGP